MEKPATIAVLRDGIASGVISATEPSTPTFQPSLRRKLASASSVINMMMTERACTPSWKPIEADTELIAILRLAECRDELAVAKVRLWIEGENILRYGIDAGQLVERQRLGGRREDVVNLMIPVGKLPRVVHWIVYGRIRANTAGVEGESRRRTAKFTVTSFGFDVANISVSNALPSLIEKVFNVFERNLETSRLPPPPPQPVAVATSVGFVPHAPATHSS